MRRSRFGPIRERCGLPPTNGPQPTNGQSSTTYVRHCDDNELRPQSCRIKQPPKPGPPPAARGAPHPRRRVTVQGSVVVPPRAERGLGVGKVWEVRFHGKGRRRLWMGVFSGGSTWGGGRLGCGESVPQPGSCLSRPPSSKSCLSQPEWPPTVVLFLPTRKATPPNLRRDPWTADSGSRMADSGSSQRNLPVAPMFVETGCCWRGSPLDLVLLVLQFPEAKDPPRQLWCGRGGGGAAPGSDGRDPARLENLGPSETPELTNMASKVCARTAAKLATLRTDGRGRVHAAHEHSRAHKLEPLWNP